MTLAFDLRPYPPELAREDVRDREGRRGVPGGFGLGDRDRAVRREGHVSAVAGDETR